jgi:hypothetical protein
VKKVIGWSLIALLLYLIVQDPSSATHLFSGVVDLLGKIARGVVDVVRGFSSGSPT